ncbi:MAG: hypothetical protein JSS04_01125 [Proteobacteria bacterium]|nr:hypothetical protein [Pseudomonadota bacterium]
MRMLPATAIACALLLAMPAFAQSNWMPPGPTDGPGGVTGAARTRDVGSGGPAVSQNAGAMPATGTSSSSMLKQDMKVGETGVPMYRSQAVMSDQPAYRARGAYIIDEYGNRYDSRGDLIGRGPAPRR